MRFDNGSAILVREHGSQRKAGWWVLAPGDDGPLEVLGPEPDDPAFAEVIMTGDSARRIHTVLRDQRILAGVGRGYADDVLNLVGLSPFVPLRSLTAEQRSRLVDAVRSVLDEGLARGAHPDRRTVGAPARTSLRRAQPGRAAVPTLWGAAATGVLRVARDRVLQALPDRVGYWRIDGSPGSSGSPDDRRRNRSGRAGPLRRWGRCPASPAA